LLNFLQINILQGLQTVELTLRL
jgi:hypothetical protein